MLPCCRRFCQATFSYRGHGVDLNLDLDVDLDVDVDMIATDFLGLI